jgi:serine/threonine protein kinase
MELVTGQSLTHLIRKLRLRTESSPERQPVNSQMVAQLVIQAAEGLESAHQLGVVHRDIEPGNLLVDEAGKLWITDFGLAQLSDFAPLKMAGGALGNLAYMSPELALGEGPVDHRADIYSLGAVLYELLTLEPPISGGDRQEILRQIADKEPRPPRELNKTILPDLEAIILMAMAKDPGQRYQTSQELAADLRHFLENKPIKAKRPTVLKGSVN